MTPWYVLFSLNKLEFIFSLQTYPVSDIQKVISKAAEIAGR
jgi:hypothetical protein